MKFQKRVNKEDPRPIQMSSKTNRTVDRGGIRRELLHGSLFDITDLDKGLIERLSSLGQSEMRGALKKLHSAGRFQAVNMVAETLLGNESFLSGLGEAQFLDGVHKHQLVRCHNGTSNHKGIRTSFMLWEKHIQVFCCAANKTS